MKSPNFFETDQLDDFKRIDRFKKKNSNGASCVTFIIKFDVWRDCSESRVSKLRTRKNYHQVDKNTSIVGVNKFFYP